MADGSPPREVKITLTAQTKEVEIGGYLIATENYGTYVPPIIRVLPGDTVAAHLINKLAAPVAGNASNAAHAIAGGNPTNLHYFHGGIVTPNNGNSPLDASGGSNSGPASPGPAGNGDNIYVMLRQGAEFNYAVPVPRDLNSRVLGGTGGPIPHPEGLNWYHSHMHGISSDQVLGGLSGLLAIGDDRVNVRAKCEAGQSDADCDAVTYDLKRRTIVRYALLRDIRLDLDVGAALPQDAPQDVVVNKAHWTPRKRDFLANEKCLVFTGASPQGSDAKELREGFCQPDRKSAWLFTLNGQRFPKVTVKGGKNLLLRLGNLSANVTYWLELYDKDGQAVIPLTVLSVDGVVPARPKPATLPGIPAIATAPVDAFTPPELLLMPASRVEILVRNDYRHDGEQTYILRSKGLNTGKDIWPAVQLAQIVLQPSQVSVPTAIALNAPQEGLMSRAVSLGQAALERQAPSNCVRDLDPGEHRRILFVDNVPNPHGSALPRLPWGFTTQIVAHRPGSGQLTPELEEAFVADPGALIRRAPFESYVSQDESIDWSKKHVCIKLDRDGLNSPQLWVLNNSTQQLHNFHIHQMKFRLARRSELEDRCIKLDATPAVSGQPKYDLFEDDIPAGTGDCRCLCAQRRASPECTGCQQSSARSSAAAPAKSHSDPVWHDTLPVPPLQKAYVMMSFVDPRQVGRFVFHCHILKHEDEGLMAPIEVWDPTPGPAQQ